MLPIDSIILAILVFKSEMLLPGEDVEVIEVSFDISLSRLEQMNESEANK